MREKLKKRLIKEYPFPSYESPSAQSQRNLMIYAIVIEFLIFIPFAFWISFSNMEYWSTRALTYMTVIFIILTGIFGIKTAHSIETTSSNEAITVKKIRNGRLTVVFFVTLYVVALILSTLELLP